MTKIAESLYKTSVDRIKVMEEQIKILSAHACGCPIGNGSIGNKCSIDDDCSACWQKWSLKEAEKAVKDE